MGYRYFDDQRLWDLTVEVFTRNGYSRSDCEDIANVLLASDRMGIESHGVQRMKLYTHSLEIGRIKRGAKSEIVRETPSPPLSTRMMPSASRLCRRHADGH